MIQSGGSEGNERVMEAANRARSAAITRQYGSMAPAWIRYLPMIGRSESARPKLGIDAQRPAEVVLSGGVAHRELIGDTQVVESEPVVGIVRQQLAVRGHGVLGAALLLGI